ncbi:hypothetical protein HanRHA438_Chr04g0189781 [Helianthus annuus]|uniref:Uncharacterized protein n=1 Tax=Helianthus annuus TaxID=4232 RepID=A0A9K3JAD5_HELAN|nr:hypothetical protein HanXRQr2_Chr04g0180091 [Helianthus annuus]KAJ0581986.1 hypothetical protein HanHA300_Chr04g0147261 [Helianthus annuus]KAJ0590109.1 hypothetical protein HanIR_Chr04g0193781 [Helianthus annuus]KAJ0597969.1 hypothetical protein HanHA89_Chr04g0160621 [Helianthus annuus]KAJ0758598.1 hypothetical protein HanLR1_Chr04g0152181 [Helianthus annuus]
MNIQSWFRRAKSISSSQPSTNQNEQHQLYGITDDLINLLKSFTLETFRNFNLQDEQGAVDGPESTKDLSSWQEKHVVLVFSKVKAFTFRIGLGNLMVIWCLYKLLLLLH